MNFRVISAILGILVNVSLPSHSLAQWEHIETPVGLGIEDFASIGETLFIGTNKGVFKSIDDGVSWGAANEGLPKDTHFVDLVNLGPYVFTVSNCGPVPVWAVCKSRILTTKNGSGTWVELGGNLPDDLRSLNAAAGSLFLLGVDGEFDEATIFRSSDYGETWSALGFKDDDIYSHSSLVSDGELLFLWGSEGLYRSADRGDNWRLVATELDFQNIWLETKEGFAESVTVESLVTLEKNLFVNATVYEPRSQRNLSGGGYLYQERFAALFRSMDDGQTWTLLNWHESERFAYDPSLNCVARSGEYLFACSWNGVYRSENEGVTWLRANNGLPAETLEQSLPLVTSLVAVGKYLYAGTWDGVYVSEDRGASWNQASIGLPRNTYVRSMAASGEYLYASLGAHGIFQSQDGAKSWVPAIQGTEVISVYALSSTSVGLFAHTRQGIYRSLDDGGHWSAIKPMPGFDRSGAVVVLEGKKIFIDGTNILFRSEDHGKNWSEVWSSWAWGVSTLFSSHGTLFAGGYEHGLFRSGDYGETWLEADVGLPEWSAGDGLTEVSDSLFVYHPIYGVFMSTNNGEDWVAVNDGLPELPFEYATVDSAIFVELHAAPTIEAANDRLFASMAQGVFVFDFEARRWRPVNDGLPPNTVVRLDGTERALFAQTSGSGIWRLNMSPISGLNQKNTVNRKAQMHK